MDLSDTLTQTAAGGKESSALKFVSLDPLYNLLTQVEGLPSPVRLLDSEWLFARAEALAAASTDEERAALALPCRQDLERDHPDAFLSLSKVRKLVSCTTQHGYNFGWTGAIAVGAISHAWITPHHPDPTGEQLLKIVSILRTAQRGELPRQQRGWDAKNPRRHGYQKLPSKLGLFYDFLVAMTI